MTHIPPGWHPDPAGPLPGQPPRLRYWDGTAWTAHVAPAPHHAPAGAPPSTWNTAVPGRTTRPTTPDGEPLAGWWRRGVAYQIDALCVGVVAGIVALPGQIGVQHDMRSLNHEMQRRLDADPSAVPLGWYLDHLGTILRGHALQLLLPGLVLTLVYQCIMLRWRGATLGKLAIGLQVRLRAAPGPLPWSSILVRVVVQSTLLSLLMLVGLVAGSVAVLVVLVLVAGLFQLLDCLWPLWDGKRQAIHDKAAGTNVVSVR